MPVDPTPFLSTVVATSAALVAIIGGLLVAKFVGLDTDQRTSRKVVSGARGRRDTARQRAEDAGQAVLRWDAHQFFRIRDVAKAVVENGVVSAQELARIAYWRHDPAKLAPFAAEAASEIERAREPLAGRISHETYLSFWPDFRSRHPDLPETSYPCIWEFVFDDVAKKSGHFERPLHPASAALGASASSTDDGVADARRSDDLRANYARAQQRVEDLEEELARVEDEHAEIIRPDGRLWSGIAILVVFTAFGVALPLWDLSDGLRNSPQVRWVLYSFAACLILLTGYIVVYLWQLTRKKPKQNA
jgi:hypothetical protein